MTRRVVITGGASGIGLTIAKRYLDEGAKVAICDNDSVLVKTVSKNYEVAISFCADVSDSNQMANFHQHIMDEFGGVDIMYANAGVGGPAGPVDEIDHQEWARCVEVNLFGAFHSASWASRIMKIQKNWVYYFYFIYFWFIRSAQSFSLCRRKVGHSWLDKINGDGTR
jgi:NAD(P)-dependent dehydrogenase (short-subunit alcohol dehydrogenase family)